MIEMQTELKHSKRADVGVKITQKVICGPNNMLDRTVTLLLPNPKEAIDLAMRILKELVPAVALNSVTDELQKLAEMSKR